MSTNFPTSLDALSNPAAGDKTNNLTTPHAAQHANVNDAIEAIEAKVGIGASTPVVNTVLRGTGVGTSAFGPVVNADVSASAAISPSKLLAHAFYAFVSATTASNKTGDGTGYTLLADAEIFDVSSAYNPGTGVFTAPETGKYQFNAMIALTNLGAGHTGALPWFATSNRSVRGQQINIGSVRDSGNSAAIPIMVLCDMDANDTCSVFVSVSGSTKTVGVIGNAGIAVSHFSGFMVG